MEEQKKKHSAIGSKVKHATGTFWYGTYLATMVIGFLFMSPKIIKYLIIRSNICSKGTFFSESTDVFVITPNRRTFLFPETENLNFGY